MRSCTENKVILILQENGSLVNMANAAGKMI